MTDNIASNDQGFDLFASHRAPAWHGLGEVFNHPVTDYKEMLVLANLADWNIREIPVEVPGTDRFAVPAKAVVATIGTENVVLGIAGDRYQIVQNEEAFSFLQSLHDGATWETAGAIKQGRVVFGSMEFDRDFVLDPTGVSDVIKSYLLVYTSHDGSTGIAGGVTPTRVVCQNTLNVALHDIKQTFKMRHTTKVAERMQAEAELWRHANKYMDAFEKEAAALFAAPVSDKGYYSLVDSFLPKPDDEKKGATKKYETALGKFAQAWNGKPNAGIKGTGWGAFNALTEANQWGRGTQKTASGAENFAAAGAGFDGPTNVFRQTALSRVKQLTGV